MKKIAIVVLVLAAVGCARKQQPANPLTAGATFHYGIIKRYVARAAAKMPEEDYPFRPTPEVHRRPCADSHAPDKRPVSRSIGSPLC